MTWRLIRISLVLVLIALIPLGAYKMYRDVKNEINAGNAQSDLYARSPGCSPGAEHIDPALSPCTEAPVTVVGVSAYTVKENVTRYDLTTRDPAGETQIYPKVWESFAAGIQPGDTISAQYWRGSVMRLSKGNDAYTIVKISPSFRRQVLLDSVGIFLVFGIAMSLLRRTGR